MPLFDMMEEPMKKGGKLAVKVGFQVVEAVQKSGIIQKLLQVGAPWARLE